MLRTSLGSICWIALCLLSVGQQTTKTHAVDDTVYRSRHISGIVVDPTGAPIPNAKVRIRKDGVEVVSANTDHNGTFSFKKLELGEYELAVQAFAFNEARYHVAVVKKSTNSEEPLRIKLRLAPLPGPVEVEPSKH